QSAARLMPSGTVADQYRVRTGRHLCADLLQVLVHGFGVDERHDDRGAGAARRTDRAEQISGIMAVVAYHRRARADRGPDVGDRALLADAGFVLEPDLDRLADRRRRQRLGYQLGEVFLNASWAAVSCFG